MERETLALHGNNFRSHVTRLIKNMYVKLVDLLCEKSLHTPQTIRTNGHQLCQENTCASHNHGAQFYFWELRDAYFFLHLDSYVYEKRVELMYDIN
jgi:hypothetical protein